MKNFAEQWTKKEIDEWLDIYNVLVLFKPHWSTKTAEITIYGKMDTALKIKLVEDIAKTFGGAHMTKKVCNKVNEFAEKWYNKYVLKRRARVINTRKK